MIIARRHFLAGITLAGFHVHQPAPTRDQSDARIMARYVQASGISFDLDLFPPGPDREIAIAVADGDIQNILIVAQQAPQGLDVVSSDGVTPLLIAVAQVNKPMITALLKAGANPNGGPDRAPIALAIRNSDLSVARELLNAGANPNGTIGTETALYKVALLNYFDGARLLLEYHANVDEPDSIGVSPIECAASADNYRMVLMLLDYGASIWSTDNIGRSIAQFAFHSRLVPSSPEYPALTEVISRLKQAGYPWPPPDVKQVRALRAAGEWPPPGITQ